MKALFIDTNLFIQCKELIQLPWDTISKDDNVLLLISRPVQDEIDRFKNQGNTRRAKHARKANSLFNEILETQDSYKTIRNSNPKVQLSFSPKINIHNYEIPCVLDLSRPDDMIIAEAIIYKNTHKSEDVSILTHDTNPILTARECNLSYIKIPEDWLLPPEPDERDKRIVELERKNKELEKTYPDLEIVAKDVNQNPFDTLQIPVVRYSNLTDLELEEFLTNVKNNPPKVTKFDSSVSWPQISDYENRYTNWLNSVKRFYQSLPSRLESKTRYTKFTVSIFNKGNVPAENVLVEFTTQGGILLKNPNQDNKEIEEQNKFMFPQPPDTPKARDFAFSSLSESLWDPMAPLKKDITRLINLTMPTIDRYAFSLKDQSHCPFSIAWTFECSEFRHQVEPKVFYLIIWVPTSDNNSDNIAKGVLKCRVTARNLPEPIEKVLPIKITYTQGNIVEQARSIIEKSIE